MLETSRGAGERKGWCFTINSAGALLRNSGGFLAAPVIIGYFLLWVQNEFRCKKCKCAVKMGNNCNVYATQDI